MAYTSSRVFTHYVANITLTFNIPGFHEKIFTDCEFICAFCLRSLRCNPTLMVRRFFPRKFIDIDVDYKILIPSVPMTPHLQYSPLYCTNYMSIVELMVRNVISVLGFETALKYVNL